jgi:hypothetical protein
VLGEISIKALYSDYSFHRLLGQALVPALLLDQTGHPRGMPQQFKVIAHHISVFSSLLHSRIYS